MLKTIKNVDGLYSYFLKGHLKVDDFITPKWVR